MMTASAFDDAIMAHAGFVGRFENALSGLDREPFDRATIGDDTRCAFGRWMMANADLLDRERYARMHALHRAFHEEAAAIAGMLRARPAAEVAQVKRQRFDILSEQLLGELEDARDEVAQRPPAR